jgi:hypothetical protein
MPILMLQAANRPDRLPLSAASTPIVEPPCRAKPGMLAPDEIRRLVLEILG